MKRLIFMPAALLLAASFATTMATAADTPKNATRAQEVSLPFVNHDAIRDWQADGQDGIWVQDVRKQWYYGKMMSPCWGLDFAVSVGFQTHNTGTLDRFGYVVVPGERERCALTSFVKSDAPPPAKMRKHGKAKEVKAADGKAAAAPAEKPAK